jgi:hypothetical protein
VLRLSKNRVMGVEGGGGETGSLHGGQRGGNGWAGWMVIARLCARDRGLSRLRVVSDDGLKNSVQSEHIRQPAEVQVR